MNIRLNIIFLIILGILLTLLSRVYFLSIKSNTYYEELSKNNYINRVYKVPIRGLIEDRNGKKLAINEMGFSIYIKPHLNTNKNKDKFNEAMDLIVKHFPEYERDKLVKIYKRNDSPYNHDFVKVIDYIPYEDFFTKYTIFSSRDEIKVESSTKELIHMVKLVHMLLGILEKLQKKIY